MRGLGLGLGLMYPGLGLGLDLVTVGLVNITACLYSMKFDFLHSLLLEVHDGIVHTVVSKYFVRVHYKNIKMKL